MKYLITVIVVITLVAITAYFWHQNRKSNTNERTAVTKDLAEYSVATFAGGCFWCVESDFEKVDGVVEVISGYTGGDTKNPTYNEVSGGGTGHREAAQIYYDPSIVSYAQLLDVFWTHVNPTDSGGQFADRGVQYSTAIYYHDEDQKNTAEASKKALNDSGRLGAVIVTEILPAGEFYIAEDYHQDYHTKNPVRYGYYREGSGRNTYITDTWGDDAIKVLNKSLCITSVCESQRPSVSTLGFVKPTDSELKELLTPIQYKITQRDGTERPFDNEYWDNHREGIYVDIVSGEPLFSSTDKFDSGTGWPSFLKPIDYDFVTEHNDYKLIVKRIEIRSKIADSHLGHIIMDGPESNDFIRYCMNSASMRFVAREDFASTEYEQYESLFK